MTQKQNESRSQAPSSSILSSAVYLCLLKEAAVSCVYNTKQNFPEVMVVTGISQWAAAFAVWILKD